MNPICDEYLKRKQVKSLHKKLDEISTLGH